MVLVKIGKYKLEYYDKNKIWLKHSNGEVIKITEELLNKLWEKF